MQKKRILTMSFKKENRKRVFPNIYEKLLPVVLLVMAIIVVVVLGFAAIVGLGII